MEDRTCSQPKPSFRFAAKSLRATGPHENHAGRMLADIGARISDVRFTPKSGHAQHRH
jgi:hypothetical protein